MPDPLDDERKDTVLTLVIPYDEVLRWTDEDLDLESSLAAVVRERSLLWLRRSAIGTQYKLLVADAVLCEWKYAVASHSSQVRISWQFFVAQCGGDAESPKRRLEELKKAGTLDCRVEPPVVRIWDVNEHLLEAELRGNNRLSQTARGVQ